MGLRGVLVTVGVVLVATTAGATYNIWTDDSFGLRESLFGQSQPRAVPLLGAPESAGPAAAAPSPNPVPSGYGYRRMMPIVPAAESSTGAKPEVTGSVRGRSTGPIDRQKKPRKGRRNRH